MILLHGDVARLGARALNLVLLLDDNCCEPSASSCVAKNVANVVVTKQKRRTVVAARCVISKDVHLERTRLALVEKRLAEQRHAQAKLQSSAKDVRLKTEP